MNAQSPRPRARRAKPAALTPMRQFLASLTEIARDPAMTAEKIEALAGAQKQIASQEAEQAYNEAMNAAQRAMPAVVRDTLNDRTMSRYARLETISQFVDPVVHGNGFTLSYGTADSVLEEHYRVTCEVRHIGGHTTTHFADVPADMEAYEGEDKKIAVHAFGSSMTYGRRYLKCMVFDIVIKDEDNDGNPSRPDEPVSAEEAASLVELIERMGGNRDRLLRALEVDSLALLPRSRLVEAQRLILARKDG
jgi:hypothetical protein